jgi:hypothetical protein
MATTSCPHYCAAGSHQVEYDAGTQLYGFSDWSAEKMGARRVMGDAVLLPNGNVVILNGAQVGFLPHAAHTACNLLARRDCSNTTTCCPAALREHHM